jgi:hypothetical protein
MILSLGTLEKVKLYKARHLVEVTVAREPDLLEAGFAYLGNSQSVSSASRALSVPVPDNSRSAKSAETIANHRLLQLMAQPHKV